MRKMDTRVLVLLAGLAASGSGGRLIPSPSMFTGPWICCKKLSDFEPDATLLH